MVAAQTVADARPPAFRELGRYLARARQRAHLTQPELAERTNLSQGYIAHLEAGHRRPSPETLYTLARALAVDPNEAAIVAGFIRTADGLPEGAPIDALDRRWSSLPRRLKEQLLRAADVFIEYPPQTDGGNAGPEQDPGTSEDENR